MDFQNHDCSKREKEVQKGIIEIFWKRVFGLQNRTKCYYGILDNLYVRQKVVLWFGKGQKYEFLSCPLPPVCPVPETVLQIKH
ncbi:hypothetical protein MTR_4g113525 [Medicago truncatula]|uniref:Uncharacterized protein n=1 Tax=Medicago truncatula TaxID=3880 RepID=A0A072UQK0_MEDTR|nr:hypothetical protein MTR_4g113525 [Medicago truncatula]